MSNVIRIEEKAYFYNSEVSLDLDYVDNVKRSYDKNFIFKAITIGYQKWSAESESGIDDPQTKKTYATLFEQIGTPVSLLSKFFAAGLAIEQTRRNTAEQGKDWRLDDDTMIIALNISESPATYEPEFDENFSSITGLINSDTRYNLRLTPLYNFLRWINYLRGCLEAYPTSEFKFTGGEGNYDFAGTMDSNSDCILDNDANLAENDNIENDIDGNSTDFLHTAIVFDFEYKLSWSDYKTIRDNRRNAISFNIGSGTTYVCFIDVLEWSPNEAKATFKVWLKETIEDVPPSSGTISAEPGVGQVIVTGKEPAAEATAKLTINKNFVTGQLTAVTITGAILISGSLPLTSGTITYSVTPGNKSILFTVSEDLSGNHADGDISCFNLPPTTGPFNIGSINFAANTSYTINMDTGAC